MPKPPIGPAALLCALQLGACSSSRPAPSTEATAAAADGAQAAAVTPAAAASAADAVPAATDEILETTRRSVRSTVEWLARGVDGWFGDKPFDEGGKVSDGQMITGLRKQQGQSAEFNLRFNAHFRLPNVEQHGYLFIGRDDQRDVVTDTPQALSSQERLLPDRPTDRTLLAGIGLITRGAIDFRLGLGAGIKPYAQASSARQFALDRGTVVDARETLFLTFADHLGSTTALSVEKSISETWAVRWLSAATITQVSKNFDWSSTVGAYKSLGEQRRLSLEALFTGTEGSGVGVSDYGLQVRWEQPLYKTWLLGEILGGHFWPRPDAQSERTRAWAVGATLKMRF